MSAPSAPKRGKVYVRTSAPAPWGGYFDPFMNSVFPPERPPPTPSASVPIPPSKRPPPGPSASAPIPPSERRPLGGSFDPSLNSVFPPETPPPAPSSSVPPSKRK